MEEGEPEEVAGMDETEIGYEKQRSTVGQVREESVDHR